MTSKRTAGLLCLIAVSVMTAPFAKADQTGNAREAAVVLNDIGGTPEEIAVKGQNGENAMLGLNYEGKEAVIAAENRDKNIEIPAAENRADSTDKKAPPSPASGGLTPDQYYGGQVVGEIAGLAASAAVLLLGGLPALMIASAIVGAGFLAAIASKNGHPPYLVAIAGMAGAMLGAVVPVTLVAAGAVFIGPKVADWLNKRSK